MARFISNKTKILSSVLGVVLGLSFVSGAAFADSYKVECASGPECEADTTFQVNVHEFLLVTLSLPDNWADGNLNTLLRNPVGLTVASNNGVGFVAYMTTKTTNTDLTNLAPNSTSVIKTLEDSTTANSFPANYWGYSLDDSQDANDEWDSDAHYVALVGSDQTPATVLSRGYNDFSSKNALITFGAKADSNVESGVYANTVVFSVVSGINTDPTTPTNPTDPVNPTDPGNAGENPYYDGSRTIATTTNNSGSTTTTTITSGDTRTTYSSPAGVTTSNLGSGSPLATGLAITAAVAATTGFIFFIIAKRRKDDEEEEDEEEY